MERLCRLATFVISRLLVLFAAFSATALQAVSLEGAVEHGLARSPELRTEQARLEERNIDIDIERDAWYPGLQGSAELSSGESATRYELRASQTLYDWGVTGHRVDRARAQRDTQSIEIVMARQRLALDIATYYLDWMSSNRRLQAVEEQISRLDRLVQLTRERVGVVADRVELTRAELALARAEEERVIIRGEQEDAKVLLEQRTGLALRNDGLVAAELPTAWLVRAPNRAVAQWVRHSPMLKQAKLEKASAAANVEVARSENLPRLSVDAIAERIEDRRGPRSDNRIALRIETPFFQGLSAFRRPRAAGYGLEAAEQEIATVREQLLREVKSARTLAKILDNRKPSLAEQLASAEETIDLYFDQFLIGRRDVVDLVGAENERVEAVFSSIEITIEQARLSVQVAADLGMLVPMIRGDVFGISPSMETAR
ncbi:TolC family protein [Marinobacter fonticola]|uniref:TolC family protein n=1 Tax=Marinobacter fonticola TaxID=2603215 RepID=UPI0011E7DC2F|nr:TolC family protein [Marinobacter fonticola]